MARPALKRQSVDYIVGHYSLPRRRACGIVRQQRSTNYYRSRKDPKTGLRTRMRELAQTRVPGVNDPGRSHCLSNFLTREDWLPHKLPYPFGVCSGRQADEENYDRCPTGAD